MQSPRAPAGGSPSRRILVADPAEEPRALLFALAREHGFEPHAAPSARATLELCADRGPFACVVAEHDLPDGGGVALLAALRERWPGTARVLVTESGDLDLFVRALREGGIRHLLRKPLREGDVLAALHDAVSAFEDGERERRLVDELCFSRDSLLQLMGSLEERLAARGQAEQKVRDELQHATAVALARLAGLRDDETGQHLERVSRYCRLIALGLRADGCYADELTDRFVEDLVRAAPLHDIGKVGIPDHILRKPGRLDAEEWEVMRRHTSIGGDTLRSILPSTRPGCLRLAHDVALYHHERWDGGGYPAGLAGRAIPLGARILALADVYDALTTRRPYKEPWPHARALELVRSESGRQFDPAVAAAFLRRAGEADRIRILCPDAEPETSRAAPA